MLDGEPCSILENEFVKPGKGQAFNRVKLRNLKSGRVWERTFKSGDTLEGADVMDVDLEYSYTDGEFWYFMDPNTFEQHSADKAAVSDAEKWLKEQEKLYPTLVKGIKCALKENYLWSHLSIGQARDLISFSSISLSSMSSYDWSYGEKFIVCED